MHTDLLHQGNKGNEDVAVDNQEVTKAKVQKSVVFSRFVRKSG
jgi:hypothetical protein